MLNLIKDVEKNPWSLALAVIVANIGVNFILDDLSEKQKKVLNNCFLRKIYMFALIYCATKNLMISLIVTLLYAMIVHWM